VYLLLCEWIKAGGEWERKGAECNELCGRMGERGPGTGTEWIWKRKSEYFVA